MGRNSGGITSSGGNKGSSGYHKGTTENGYTSKMVKNILSMEQKYRKNKDETLHVFSDTGNIVTSIGGKGAKVVFNPTIIPKNSILTHNHPRSLGAKNAIERIGHSFSRDDVMSAVVTNAKEIRAVTPTYTFSLKRPKGGWGLNAKQAGNIFRKVSNSVTYKMKKYISQNGWSQTSIQRANATYSHDVMQIMSKKYGWIYTKKNN